MKVKLDRTFPMPASAGITWGVLRDLEAVAPCMPGAAITERIDAQHYKGTVALKVGPASLKFKGAIEVSELDDATNTLRLVASGTDTSGASAASMDLTARVETTEDGRSNLIGHAEASVSGKVAAFASRMMDAVADQILKQFAANFARLVEAKQQGAPPIPGAGTTATLASESAATLAPESAATTSPSASAPATSLSAPASSSVSGAARAPGAAAESASATAPRPPTAPPQELNALALLWAVLRDWLRGLFSKKVS